MCVTIAPMPCHLPIPIMRILCLLLLTASTSSTPAAQTIDDFLDLTFGDGGTVAAAFPGTPYDVAVSGSGRIVVAAIESGVGFYVARFLPDGSPDLAFGTDGLASIPYPDTHADPDDLNNLTLALQPGGQTVVATRRTDSDAVPRRWASAACMGAWTRASETRGSPASARRARRRAL